MTRADKLANEALRRVNSTQQRIEAIFTDLHQVGNIDRSKVMELQQLMAQIRANFDQRLLGGTVKQLLAAVANQRQWLEAMRAKKQSLQRQIRSMRDLQEQLRPWNSNKDFVTARFLFIWDKWVGYLGSWKSGFVCTFVIGLFIFYLVIHFLNMGCSAENKSCF